MHLDMKHNQKKSSTLRKFIGKLFGKQDVSRYHSSCPVCGNAAVKFLPLPEFYRENARRYGHKYFGKGEMTSLDTYFCAACGASDRERLYALWIDQQLNTNRFCGPIRFIHFAPEPALSAKLRQVPLFEYITADFTMTDVDYRVDMMDMPFRDEHFDFFLCSHVLEHVENDNIAISELFRITKHGGCGILMAPIIIGLEKTIEDPTIKDDAGRWKYFGQNDHVRLYARNDYVRKIASYGFRVMELGEKYFGKEAFSSLGLKRTSILYVVTK
jgi:SAM-dependent methyltransferase